MRFTGLLRFTLPVLIGFTVVLLMLTAAPAPRPASAAGANLTMPIAACSGSAAQLAFRWTPIAGGSQQWLDLSIQDDNFAPASFLASGPLTGTQNALVWDGILKGMPHYWRVNTLTSAGWVVSETSVFVPCGGPALLWGPIDCPDFNTATVHFRWAPPAPPASLQYIDLGFDPNFAPGTFAAAGPLAADLHAYDWRGVQSNVSYFFRVNALGADGVWRSSTVGNFAAQCAPSISTEIYGSPDVLIAPRLGIRAVVNVRDVGYDGALGDPAGPTDVVRYSFPIWPGFGGYPGDFGTTVVSGHVDYRSYGLAVFAPLRDVQVGDIFEYYRWDGAKITYAVDWFADLPPNYDWNSLTASSNPESLLMITCNGTFNYATREYDHRRAVHAARIY